MKRLFFILISIALFYSCDNESTRTLSGDFILTKVNNASGSVQLNSDPASGQSEIDLGQIKASREFFFALSSSYDSPITNINISSDNEAFKIVQGNISVIPVSDAEQSVNLVPIISVIINHGKQIDGIGYNDLLPMGDNSANITITGETNDGTKDIELKQIFTLNVDAKVMDIKFPKTMLLLTYPHLLVKLWLTWVLTIITEFSMRLHSLIQGMSH